MSTVAVLFVNVAESVYDIKKVSAEVDLIDWLLAGRFDPLTQSQRFPA